MSIVFVVWFGSLSSLLSSDGTDSSKPPSSLNWAVALDRETLHDAERRPKAPGVDMYFLLYAKAEGA